MKTYINAFLLQLAIIGLAINIRHDIPYWQQLIAYVMIASILPITMYSIKFSSKE